MGMDDKIYNSGSLYDVCEALEFKATHMKSFMASSVGGDAYKHITGMQYGKQDEDEKKWIKYSLLDIILLVIIFKIAKYFNHSITSQRDIDKFKEVVCTEILGGESTIFYWFLRAPETPDILDKGFVSSASSLQEIFLKSLNKGYVFSHLPLNPLVKIILPALKQTQFKVNCDVNIDFQTELLDDMEDQLIKIIRNPNRASEPIRVETSGDKIKSITYSFKVPTEALSIHNLIELAKKLPGQTKIESVYLNDKLQGNPKVRKELSYKDLK